MSLPQAFRERLERIIPRDKLPQILSTFDAPKNVTFRVNTPQIHSTTAGSQTNNS